MNTVWTEAEDNFVRQNAARLKDRELAATLTRLTGRPISEAGVRQVRKRLGIKKKPGRGVCELYRPAQPGAAVGLTINAS